MLSGTTAQTAVGKTTVTVQVPCGHRVVVITDDSVVMSKETLMELRAVSLGLADTVEVAIGHNPRTSHLRRLVKRLRGT